MQNLNLVIIHSHKRTIKLHVTFILLLDII